MAISAARTIVLPAVIPQFAGFAVAPPFAWPMAEPADALDYSLDYTDPLADDSDTIAFASIDVAPSGDGELTINAIVVAGAVLTAWLGGGVAGRHYLVNAVIETTAGRTIQLLIGLLIDPALAIYPLAAPPSPGFGTATTWGIAQTIDYFAPTLDFSNSDNSGLFALI